MLIKKRLRRTQSLTSYQTKKQQVAKEITKMRLAGYTVADISAKYDIPPKVVERFCQTHLRELMPEFNDKEYQRMLRLGQLDQLLQPKIEAALETGDHRSHELALKTLAQIIQVSGISDAMIREELKVNGVIRHEHSGSVQLTHEIGAKAQEALATFKALSAEDRKASLPRNTHTEKTTARELIDRQIRALPKAPPPDMLDIVDAELVEDE